MNVSFTMKAATMYELRFRFRDQISFATVIMIATLVVTGIVQTVHAKLASPLPIECQKQIRCQFTSSPGDYLTSEDLIDFPLLKELTDLRPNSTLMHKYDADDYMQRNMTVRKVFLDDKVYLFRTGTFYDFLLNVLYPEVVPLPKSNDAKTLQECLERHCKKANNPKNLECQSAILEDWDFVFNERLTEECMNLIIYIDYRNTTFKTLNHTKSYFPNVRHVNFQSAKFIDFDYRYLILYFPKGIVFDLDDGIEMRRFTKLAFTQSNVIEINTPTRTYWLPWTFDIEKYEHDNQCLSLGNTNYQHTMITYKTCESVEDNDLYPFASALSQNTDADYNYDDFNEIKVTNLTIMSQTTTTTPNASISPNGNKRFIIVVLIFVIALIAFVSIVVAHKKMRLPCFKF